MTVSDPLFHVPILRLAPSGETLVTFHDFDTVEEKIAAIGELGQQLDQVQQATAIARAIRDPAALHEWRRAHLDYELEAEQTLQSADHAIVRGSGDCTAHAAVAVACAQAIDRAWALVTFGGTEDDPEHVSVLIAVAPAEKRARPPTWLAWEGSRCIVVPGWAWSDTSVPIGQWRAAPFGVAPACPLRFS